MSRPRGLLFGVAGASLVAGISLIGVLTAQESPLAAATASTTTTVPVLISPTTTIDLRTWSVSKIATGEPITWANGVGVGATWPIDLVDHNGKFFLFGSSRPNLTPDVEQGLDMWSSPDGRRWEAHGKVIPAGFTFTSVTAGDDGLIALGSSDVDGSLRMWLSDDGVEWEMLTPSVQDLETGFRDFPVGAVRSRDTTVFASTRSFDEYSLIGSRLPTEYAGFNFRIWPPGKLTVYGPAGIPIWETSVEELGLELEAVTPVNQGYRQESTIWVMSDDQWSTTTIEDTDLSSLAVLANGKFAATGWGPRGGVLWISTDGLSWDQASDIQNQSQHLALGPQGAITYSLSQRFPLLSYSTDLVEWETLGLEEILPDEIDWWFDPVVLNDHGIALFAHGYSNRFESNQPQSTSITRNGFELTYRPDLEGLVLSDGEEVWTMPTYSPTLSSLIAVDVPGKTVTFLRPQTEESLATFTFNEIASLETDAWGGLEPSNEFTAFLHTTDRVNWMVQDLPLIPDNLFIMNMVLTEDQVIVAAIDTFTFAALSSTPNLRILVGDLP